MPRQRPSWRRCWRRSPLLAQPSPRRPRAPTRSATSAAPRQAVSEARRRDHRRALLGGGNPVGDACNSVSGKVGQAAIKPITQRPQEGRQRDLRTDHHLGHRRRGWLIGKVVGGDRRDDDAAADARKGFLAEYATDGGDRGAAGGGDAALGGTRGSRPGQRGDARARPGVVNLPLAFVATSVAYALVQLLLVATDGLCHAIAAASHDNSRHFFEAAITDLGEVGGDRGQVGGGSDGANRRSAARAKPPGRSRCRSSSPSSRRSSAPSPPSSSGWSC